MNYNVQANTGAARSGTLTIAGQTFTNNQAVGAPTCSFTLTANNANVGTSGGALLNVGVTASASNCAWTATSNVNWVTRLDRTHKPICGMTPTGSAAAQAAVAADMAPAPIAGAQAPTVAEAASSAP